MGKKLDALLGRTFKPSKFKPLVNLALSRLVVLKSQRQVRCTQARSDVVQLLDLGHHERALIRVSFNFFAFGLQMKTKTIIFISFHGSF